MTRISVVGQDMDQCSTQFEILDRVDVGGMAEIFRARNLETGEIVAIKRILPMLASQSDFVKMFVDEAAVCMSLHHPNIVRVDQIGLMNDALFLSMEYVDGTNLREVLNFASQYSFQIPIPEVVRIAIHVLDGLAYAHTACNSDGEPLRLIHRDVSPPNILIGYNGDVKLTDFGLVKSKMQMTRTVPGLIKGKFSYLSPEAAYGESIDLRSDLYAVGIILWEMLTCRPLFNDPVEMKILDLVRKSIIPPISSINPSVPPELESIVLKGLARNRADRYQTASEFAADLRGFLKSIGNPPSELGKIIAAIKPPKHVEETADKPARSSSEPHPVIPLKALDEASAECDSDDSLPVQPAVSPEDKAFDEMPTIEMQPPKKNDSRALSIALVIVVLIAVALAFALVALWR